MSTTITCPPMETTIRLPSGENCRRRYGVLSKIASGTPPSETSYANASRGAPASTGIAQICTSAQMLWGYGTCLPTKIQLPVSVPNAFARIPPEGSGDFDGSLEPTALGMAVIGGAIVGVGDCTPVGELVACSGTQPAIVTRRVASTRIKVAPPGRPRCRAMRKLSAADWGCG